MKSLKVGRTSFAGAILMASLSLASPAQATRDIVIDRASQSNTLTACGAFAGCQQLSSGSVGIVNISPTGFIEIADGRGGFARFSVGASSTVYQVLSGYTVSGANVRTDFISFYAPGNSTAILPSGNRPAADFQVQFKQITGRPLALGSDLEIAFAYNNPAAGAPNRVDPGATIGYSGATLGNQPGAPLGFPGLTFAGLPAQHLVTNANGLLLGSQSTDSDFAFVVGNYPDPTFRTVLGLASETFTPRYAAVAGVPEPATWAMMVLGFGAVGGAMRRRRNQGVAATA